MSSHPAAGASYPASPISFMAPLSQMPWCPPISKGCSAFPQSLECPGLVCVSKSSQFLAGLSIATCPRNPSPAAADTEGTLLSAVDGHWDHTGSLKAAVAGVHPQVPWSFHRFGIHTGPLDESKVQPRLSYHWVSFPHTPSVNAVADPPAKCMDGAVYSVSTLTRSRKAKSEPLPGARHHAESVPHFVSLNLHGTPEK